MSNVLFPTQLLWSYAYTIDTQLGLEEFEKKISVFIKDKNVKYYIFSKESGKETQKKHYQGIIYCSHNLSNKEKQGFRNIKARAWVTHRKRSVFFQTVKDEETYLSYCNDKEGQGKITNIPETRLALIPQYTPPIEKKVNDINQKHKQFVKNFSAVYDPDLDAFSTSRHLLEVAYDTYDESMPRFRTLVGKLKHVFHKEQFLQLMYPNHFSAPKYYNNSF